MKPASKEEEQASSLLIVDEKFDEDPKKEDPKPALVEIVDEDLIADPKPRSASSVPVRKTPVAAPPKVVSSPANASSTPSSTWSLQDLLIPTLAAAIIFTAIYIDYRRKN